MEIARGMSKNICTYCIAGKERGGKHSGRENSLKIKFLGRIFLGHQDPDVGISWTNAFMQVAFFCRVRQGVAGMSRDLVRDVLDLETQFARKLWADVSFPKHRKARTAPKRVIQQNF